MTKKDYKLIADVIRSLCDKYEVGKFEMANRFADRLAEEYTNFNRDKFIDACIPVSWWRIKKEKDENAS